MAQIRAAGLRPLAISARGNLARNVLTIDTTVRNADGLSLTARGTVGVTGATPLAINVNGQLPFTAAGARLAAQGIALRGDARFNLVIRGTAARPAISGSITTSGGTLTLIRQNLVIKNIAANVTLSGDQARIVNVSGALDGGGTLMVAGTVGFAPGSGLPANLKINLKNAVYVDGRIVAAKLNGDLTVNGRLQNSPTLTGKIHLNRADITIPERLPGSLSKIDVKHKNAPADVKAQSAEIRARTKGTTRGESAGGIKLDLTISAPRKIFVRGRGLDTELGGEVKVTGSSNSPNVAGGFRMVRGRLAIIGKRLDFTTGQITFGGGLMPYLNMVASSAAGSTTVYVNVNGPANSPTFSFTSSPALPQDEVLAQLIFGRSSSSLSAIQIAQLADAVATLAGGQSNSLFNRLRQGLGVDDLDIGSDENGRTNVTAGKYLNKRTYLELQQGATSKAIINLDIGKGVKLKGEAGSDGSTATGLFYEKEY
jgi:translocation and assembly module TamB